MFDKIVLIDFRCSLRARAVARKSCGPYTWTPAAPGKGSRGFYQANQRRLTMDPAGSSFALRLESADKHAPRSLRDVAYYTDDDGMAETMRPIIARLPHARGFLAGWTLGAGMAAALDLTIHDTPEEAARVAHALAESDAERERDYQREEDAKLRAEEAAEEERSALGTDE